MNTGNTSIHVYNDMRPVEITSFGIVETERRNTCIDDLARKVIQYDEKGVTEGMTQLWNTLLSKNAEAGKTGTFGQNSYEWVMAIPPKESMSESRLKKEKKDNPKKGLLSWLFPPSPSPNPPPHTFIGGARNTRRSPAKRSSTST